MAHSVALVATLAAGFGLALVMGLIAVQLKLPALVGYLIAGVLLGPATPGFVADVGLSRQLAEIGVILLMFGVGLHFSFSDLASVRRIALPGAIVQVVLATMLCTLVAKLWGWPLGAALVFGLALSVASTVVLLRALEDRKLLATVNGRIAIGWLVVQDLVMILVLVLLPPLSDWLGGHTPTAAERVADVALPIVLIRTLGKVSVFVALMYFVGRRVFPWLLAHVARTGSRELFTLCVIAVALGVAYGSAELFGVSFALGAFFAGMMMRESNLSYRAAQESLPLRDAFAVLFFVSVGMLFDPTVLIRQPLHVAGVVAIIVLVSPSVALVLLLASRYPLNTALTVAIGLAQIGEFSFILAALGVSLGLLSSEGQNLILAGALISISINPLLFRAIEPAQNWIRRRSRLARFVERPNDPLAQLPMSTDPRFLAGHVVLVGYGRVGRRIAQALIARSVPIVVAEQNRELVETLRASGISAVSGDAADPDVLIQAHIARAKVLVIATPDTFPARRMVETARMLNPGVHAVIRTHSDEDAAFLARELADKVFMGEHELALGMTRHVLEKFSGGTSSIDDSQLQLRP